MGRLRSVTSTVLLVLVGTRPSCSRTRVAGSQGAPPGEAIDPEVAARAAQRAARAPKAADAKRDIYLCHNYCELGAVRFSSVLGDVKTFLDSHPDEVVILDIQDATSPADTAALTAAGLADRVAVLEKGKPLPTLRELIDAGTNLLVFAEVSGSGAPPWYQRTYDWFQETPYTYPSVEAFDCAPNRGAAAAPLLLINHWVSEKGLASPSAASKANRRWAPSASRPWRPASRPRTPRPPTSSTWVTSPPTWPRRQASTASAHRRV